MTRSKKPRGRKSGFAVARRMSALENARPFRSNDELLQKAVEMFRARKDLTEAGAEVAVDEKQLIGLRAEERARTRHWHDCFGQTGNAISICACCFRHRLNRTEREILALLALNHLGLTTEDIADTSELITALAPSGQRMLNTVRSLSEHGRLYRAGLISYDDPDENIRKRSIKLDPGFVDSLLQSGQRTRAGWPVKTEEELYGYMGRLIQAFRARSAMVHHLLEYQWMRNDLPSKSRKVGRLSKGLKETLGLHSEWAVNKLLQEFCWGGTEWTIVVVLLGKELGHVPADDDLFKGHGLACAASESVDDIHTNLLYLMSRSPLVKKSLIRPCAGPADLLRDDLKVLEKSEFELTEKAIALTGLETTTRRKRSGEFEIREPRMRMHQLILSVEVQRILRLVLTQARCGETLNGKWGLGELIPYGRAFTLLFFGSPGTGKTACAEALAHELGKPLLVASYAQIQNSFVGMTEKNIVKVFGQAKAHDAVLLWDEADAMFSDRDSAFSNYAVREVNVLLQELERFEGICVLATNREMVLDKALERRISVKVEFKPPAGKMIGKIWRKLLPPTMPLADDVDIDRLATVELTGGEIKNIVLNAARHALCRGPKSQVAMEDFRWALDLETEGRWSGAHRIGFLNQEA